MVALAPAAAGQVDAPTLTSMFARGGTAVPLPVVRGLGLDASEVASPSSQGTSQRMGGARLGHKSQLSWMADPPAFDGRREPLTGPTACPRTLDEERREPLTGPTTCPRPLDEERREPLTGPTACPRMEERLGLLLTAPAPSFVRCASFATPACQRAAVAPPALRGRYSLRGGRAGRATALPVVVGRCR